MRWAGAWNGVALSSWSVGGMREGWEGHDQREWCAARQRSGPLDSLTPARSSAEGRGPAQILRINKQVLPMTA